MRSTLQPPMGCTAPLPGGVTLALALAVALAALRHPLHRRAAGPLDVHLREPLSKDENSMIFMNKKSINFEGPCQFCPVKIKNRI